MIDNHGKEVPLMLPEERAREKIDKQLINAGWDIVSRNEYVPKSTSAVKEALMQGNTESDYLLFVDDKAIAVVEAKREENPLGPEVEKQAEDYARGPQNWYGLWYQGLIPLVYMANGKKIYFKNMLTDPDGDYVELSEMHSPKKMLSLINRVSEYGALPRLERRGLRDCQYNAEIELEKSMKDGKKKNLAILATGSGKTYLACLASYRMLNYTPTKRILFLVDRNNLARQTEAEFSQFDRTEGQQEMSSLYEIKRLKKESDIKADIVISTIQKLFAVLTGQKLSEDSEDAEDEKTTTDEEKETKEVITLGDNLKLPPDHFQLIIVDECHRSIYGKWKAVLDYFSGAKVLGLTATPTPEAYAYFDNNIIEEYTYDESVAYHKDGDADVAYIPGSMARHNHLQLLVYLCMLEYLHVNFENFIYLPLLIMDSPDKSMEPESFEEVYPTLVKAANRIGVQTIFFSKVRPKAVDDKNLVDISDGLNPFHQKTED